MLFRFSLVCLFLSCNIRAENQLRRVPRKIGGARYCSFDDVRKNYDAADLLGCIDDLAVEMANRESGRLVDGKGELNGSTGRQISFMDIFSSFFNNDPETSHQSNPFPVNPTSGYQQPNYPSETVGLSPGFQLNLFEALSTISRHDDYKCVPRILCEMASGKLPGRSLGKQEPGFFDFLGRNVFTDWLAKFDVSGMSPLLNYGRAMILGYSNRGNSEACYEAFPRCPKNSNALVYYLNNYKGGFFRLFNRFQGGNYGRYRGAPGQRVEVKERVVTGNGPKEYIESGPFWGTVDFSGGKYQQYFGKTEFPRYDEIKGNNDIAFPKQEDSTRQFSTINEHNDISESGSIFQTQDLNTEHNDIREYGPNIWQNGDIPFFPRERDGRRFSHIRFPSDFELTSTD